MTSVEQLINTDQPAILDIRKWVQRSENPCEILAPSSDRERVLLEVGVSTFALLGALAYETGGILIDHGWLRFLGSGSPKLPRNLADWNRGRCRFCLVADDAIGGFFGRSGGEVYYWAPEKFDWEPLGLGFTEFFRWSLTPALADFYRHLRWPTWREDVKELPGDRCYGFDPFLWTKEGTVEGSEKRLVLVSEAFDLKANMLSNMVGKQAVQVIDVDGVIVVCFKDLTPVIAKHGLEPVEQELWALVDRHQSAPIILDFEKREFPPSHVVQSLLIRLHMRLGTSLQLCNLPSMVDRHFKINKLAKRLNIRPTREDALAALKS